MTKNLLPQEQQTVEFYDKQGRSWATGRDSKPSSWTNNIEDFFFNCCLLEVLLK